MDRPSSAARRRTFDLPSKPETGLAEWTSKIKELQRQVDEDEEAETRRLEEEIRASRMARLRRSGQINSADLSKSDIPRVGSPPASPLGRQEGHDDALKKLTGQIATSPTEHAKPAATPKAPISLAEFMGGRAAGPRLTRHAPQQDAHDPTQFEQRTLKDITTPHPIFGRGGVAMPGLVGKNRTGTPSTEPEEPVRSPTLPTHVTGRERKHSTPSVVQSIIQKVEVESVSSHRTGTSVSSSYTTRQRTISTPTGGTPVSAPPTRTWDTIVQQGNGASSRPVSVSPGLRSTTPAQDRQTPLKSPYTPPPVSSSPRPPSSARSPVPTSPTTSSSPKAPISTPSLARPIQPSPRTSLGPQIPASLNPSPAFLRAPPPKDPTPSISRLQGRGFVKSMVQATAQLSTGSPSPPERKDTPSNSGGRKSTPVLDRWQNAASTPSPPPIISPKPAAMRKSWTVDPSLGADTTPPRPIKADYTGRSLKSASSVPSLADAVAAAAGDGSPRGRGLGSSTTMISYIKPLKTGDRPSTPPQDRARSRSRSKSRSRAASPERDEDAGFDEMGMRVGTRSKSRHRSQSRHRSKSREAPRGDVGSGERRGLPPVGAGKPLSHLTKDRAKKPRKARFASNPVRETRVVSPAASVTAEQAARLEQQQPSHTPPPPVVPSVVVSASDVTQPAKPASPLKNRFDDDFAPPASPPIASKPSQLSELVIPKSPATASTTLEQPMTPTRKTTPPKAPASPARHTRIPSTGNRATVMDVAQALAAQSALSEQRVSPQEPPSPKPHVVVQEEEAEEAYSPPDVKAIAAHWGHSGARPSTNGGARPNAEMRKSSYERYSAIVMPPLKEERTPVPSPTGTLAKSTVPVMPEVILETEVEAALAAESKPAEAAVTKTEVIEEPLVSIPAESKVIHIDHVDEPLPEIDVTGLLHSGNNHYVPDADVQTISVDVMSVVGNVATAVSREPHVFYDHDVLAIIHRAKVRSTGLVSTKVWGWRGKHGRVGEREEQKLQGLARQYGTQLIPVQQYCESAELVTVLGGRLAIRQGSRSHWSPENTAMHLVRSLHGVTYIDEVELSIRNLCSAFSYCLSLLDTLYVWHGCGSIDNERIAAQDYAKALASSSSNIVELIEGQSDADDEMFWMILGEGEYARADYWKWRASALSTHPRVWSVDITRGADAIQPVPFFADHPELHNLVHLVDCIWEFFVVVGSEARGKRADIKLALAAATRLSELTASSRPFAPTVHALILPSRLPTDLRLHFRDLDESAVNYGQVPEHMNLLAVQEAIQHLKTTVWERTLTKDPSMLPLGVQTSDLR